MNQFLPPEFKPGTAVAPSTVVEISISCRKLLKSDPMVVVFVTDSVTKGWKECGESEIIWNNANPDFVRKFEILYYFQESQKIKFEVYHVKSDSSDLSSHHYLGGAECTLGQIVSSTRLTEDLKNEQKKNNGHIILSAEELSSCKEKVTLSFRAHNLEKKDFFGKSDPYLEFRRFKQDSSYPGNHNNFPDVVHRTEVIPKTLDPTWKTFTTSVRTLCNGDYNRKIKVDCLDWNRSGNPSFIGSFLTTMEQLSSGPGAANTYLCINEEMKAKHGHTYSDSGTVELTSCLIQKESSFLDYIRGKTKLKCTFSVSFSVTNGDPKSKSSLHYMDPYKPNAYETAIKTAGDIMSDYSRDQPFSAIGFGARLPPKGEVSHNFALTGKQGNGYCESVDEVLLAYRKSLRSVQLYGPSNFAPSVEFVANLARETTSGTHYYILIILTDGSIADMPQTMEAIVNASSLPMSIIIIGIGEAKFTQMSILDGDDVRLTSNVKTAERDIVQFVKMRDFLGSGENSVAAKTRFGHEVLEEVPRQLLSYMQAHNIRP